MRNRSINNAERKRLNFARMASEEAIGGMRFLEKDTNPRSVRLEVETLDSVEQRLQAALEAVREVMKGTEEKEINRRPTLNLRLPKR